MRKEKVIGQVFLSVEELDHRIAPGLTDLCGATLTVPTISCPPPPTDTSCPPPTDTSCPPPTDTSCPPPTDTSGGNNGFGNGGHDGVPGNSSSNPSPSADQKAAVVVR